MVRNWVFGLGLIIGAFLIMVPQSVYAAAGDVWIQPSYTSVSTNSTFTLEVHADTGSDKLGAYQFTITFAPALINVDTTKGTNGVEAGTDGFIAAVNTDNTNGTITVNGFDITGTGPGSDLQVLIIYFDALNSVGQSPLGLDVATLANESTATIGTPNGIGGSIIVDDNNPPSAFGLVYPSNGQTGLGTGLDFRWKESSDPDGDTVTYDLYYCENQDFSGCSSEEVGSLENSRGTYYAGTGYGAGLLVFGMVIAGGIKGRRKIALLIAMIMITGMILVSCGGGGSGNGGGDTAANDEVSYTVSGLNPDTTYYWKVVAKDGNGGETESNSYRFTTAL